VIEIKIRKVGNSLGVVLPKEAIGALKVKEGDSLLLGELSDGGYRITPYDEGFERKMKKAEEIMGRYRNTLRKLSE
jgi:putative addiction module antidote